MNKQQFVTQLAYRLQFMPQNEASRAVSYYNEMISDRIEEGMSEEAAVLAMGSIDEVVMNILEEQSITNIVKTKVNSSKNKMSNKGLWIAIAILGLPMWVMIIALFIAMAVSVIAIIFTIIVAIVALVFSVIMTGPIMLVGGLGNIIGGYLIRGLGMLSIGCTCLGVVLFIYKPIVMSFKALGRLLVWLFKEIKRKLVRGVYNEVK